MPQNICTNNTHVTLRTTVPNYPSLPQNNCTKFMETVVLTIYNYGTNTREECLLIRLFRHALREEIQRKVDKVQDIRYNVCVCVFRSGLYQTLPHDRTEGYPNNCTKFMETVVLTIYNYGTNTREECLLIRLFRHALREEIQRKVDKVQDISTGSPTVIKIVVGYYRGAQGNQNSLKSLLGPLIEQVMEDKELNMNIHPLEVYKAWISRMESETGQASQLPYDVTPEQALKHKEVTDEIENTIKKLVAIIQSFQEKIISSVDKMPYGIRYMAMCLRKDLKEKFPESSDEEIMKAVGNLLYYRYMNPVITAPDSFEIVDLEAGKTMNNIQRRNLGSIAKILQHAASYKIFDSDAKYLASLNAFIKSAYIKFMEFFATASAIDEIEDHFNMDEFSDVTMLNKPMIFISPNEICSTHKLLLDHQNEITEGDNDPLTEVLSSLGPVPEEENEQMLGGEKSTEFGLVLTNKWELNMSDESNTQALFSKTKYLVVDLLRIQRGESLTSVLHTGANKQQQELYRAIHSRRMAEQQGQEDEEEKNAKLSVFDPNDTTIDKLKQHILNVHEEIVSQIHMYDASN
eukprot:sb/3463403/